MRVFWLVLVGNTKLKVSRVLHTVIVTTAEKPFQRKILVYRR